MASCRSSGGGSHVLLPFASLSQENSCMNAQQFQVYGKVEQKASTKIHCLQQLSLLQCLGTVQHIGVTHSSVPGDTLPLLPNALQAWNCFSPCNPGDPRPCCLFPGVCPSSPQEHPKPDMTPVVGRIQTLQNLHSAAYNILG